MSQVINRSGFTDNIWANTPLPDLADYTNGPAMRLTPATDPAEVTAHFASLDLIVVPFEASADGRGFSQAAQLRALGFDGHIRAQGHILVDQFRAALKTGFTDIEISDAQAARNPERQWLAVTLSEGYMSQLLAMSGPPASDTPSPPQPHQ